jgi:hypothetical protein
VLPRSEGSDASHLGMAGWLAKHRHCTNYALFGAQIHTQHGTLFGGGSGLSRAAPLLPLSSQNPKIRMFTSLRRKRFLCSRSTEKEMFSHRCFLLKKRFFCGGTNRIGQTSRVPSLYLRSAIRAIQAVCRIYKLRSFSGSRRFESLPLPN